MSLSGLLDAALADPALADLVDAAGAPELTLSTAAGVRALPIALLAARANRTVLAVTSTGAEADELAETLQSLLPPDEVVVYPSWETLPHERLSPRADTVGKRLAVLRRLRHPEPVGPAGPVSVVVAPVRSVLQPQVNGLGDLRPVSLKVGDYGRELTDLVADLIAAGYSRTELVERRGDIAVRGGILDVFPPTEEHPLRVEFWGDEVEEIRYFAVADQRSLAVAENGLWAAPCREMLLTDDVRARAAELAAVHPELRQLLDPISEGGAVEGMESLLPVLVDSLGLVLDELAPGTHVVVCDPERVRTRSVDLVRTSEEFLAASWAAAAGGGQAPVDLGAASLRELAYVRSHAAELNLPWWSITPFGADTELAPATDHPVLTSGFELPPDYRGDLDALTADLRTWTAAGWRVVAVFDGHGTAQRAVERLLAAELPARLVEKLEQPPEPGIVSVSTGHIGAGGVAAGIGLAVLSESDITGQRGVGNRGEVKLPSRRRRALDPLQLQPGDLIVHEQHGVGRYVEMVRRTVNGGEREYLIVEYAAARKGQPADRLFVPTDSLDQLTRYVGGESPSLNRLGGSDWAKTKGRARKAVKEIAAGLIRLYSARMATKGHAFAPDTPWQRELEDAFPYVETPDQLAAINEVKADMEKPLPMDRIICGDVGYGKTEVAVRAAFKAVQDGKQVAVLVPTTLLAQQHHSTFSERMSQFPVTIKELSRFTSTAEADQTLAGVVDGGVDIVIGTHRLLQQTVRFKNLGLVVVDEEQRFGVEHKEYLKSLRTAVDVLTMSATPIPRTLEMSLTGIREMTTILTPPEERHPILTFVGAYDERQIAAAIRRELLRDGQVFYIHNRISSIGRAAAHLADLVPEARIAVGHGQMAEHELERVMVGFWQKEYDVLVSTTIVESGLDIPNSNTLVVERADTFGLSQLHQLRGRVGRGAEASYCILLGDVGDEAAERLRIFVDTDDGFEIARADLRLRGMGNLFGQEQSGEATFRIADPVADEALNLKARAAAEIVLERDPDLAARENAGIRKVMSSRYARALELFRVG